MPPSSHKTRDTFTPISIDPKEIRQHIRLLIRHLSSVHDWDTPRQTAVIVNEIWHLVEYADLQLQRGEPAQALLTLKAVTDTCTTQGMYLNDFHSDVSTFFQNLKGIPFKLVKVLSHPRPEYSPAFSESFSGICSES